MRGSFAESPISPKRNSFHSAHLAPTDGRHAASACYISNWKATDASSPCHHIAPLAAPPKPRLCAGSAPLPHEFTERTHFFLQAQEIRQLPSRATNPLAPLPNWRRTLPCGGRRQTANHSRKRPNCCLPADRLASSARPHGRFECANAGKPGAGRSRRRSARPARLLPRCLYAGGAPGLLCGIVQIQVMVPSQTPAGLSQCRHRWG